MTPITVLAKRLTGMAVKFHMRQSFKKIRSSTRRATDSLRFSGLELYEIKSIPYHFF
jgi:hypothetical protein